MNIAIIFAGGVGERLNNGSVTLPKQFIEIHNKPILVHTLLHFQNNKNIDRIYLAVKYEYIEYTRELLQKFNIDKVAKIVCGGCCALDSIFNALDAAYKDCPKDSTVLIHDGVRPIITEDLINKNIESVTQFGTAITSTPCYETILISKDKFKPTNVPIRKETFCAQAPQSFVLEDIYQLHLKAREENKNYKDIVDCCTLFFKYGKETHLVEGIFGNIKITTPSDLYILEGILKYQEENNAKTI